MIHCVHHPLLVENDLLQTPLPLLLKVKSVVWIIQLTLNGSTSLTKLGWIAMWLEKEERGFSIDWNVRCAQSRTESMRIQQQMGSRPATSEIMHTVINICMLWQFITRSPQDLLPIVVKVTWFLMLQRLSEGNKDRLRKQFDIAYFVANAFSKYTTIHKLEAHHGEMKMLERPSAGLLLKQE